MALRRHIELCACVTHRGTKVCQVSSLWHTYSERQSRIQCPIMGLRGRYGPVSVPSSTLSPKAMALRRHIELGVCVTHPGTQVSQVSSLWHTYSER
ncbi:hypothetical protein DPMN_032031 [Dreissena polymorpha]|uniref:Uncharacterized protein n=1 Tax=Dreissena polymorpha TaxID=45954 RepID=A0A9D4RJN2_DREPO|nr:hypothetical protein DPMN_032031 [Dreissena polymorpha]